MPAGHPERPERIHSLLKNRSLFDRRGVIRLDSQRRAGREDLLRVHSVSHINRIAETAGRPYTMLDPDTHTSDLSYETALCAAGGLLDTIDAVVNGRAENGFVMVRPPGHHAETDRAMGFCLFNNVAIGARYLLDRHGIDRVLIVDWDVHHGNGTQRTFYESNRVLFISTHQYPCYPGTGPAHETGYGEGEGFTVNVPLPPGCGNAEYAAVFDRLVKPVARQFDPQFVLVSAGFDAHRDDPLAGMCVTESGFVTLISALLDIARDSAAGRLVAVLEGGYNLGALVSSVDAVVATMCTGEDTPRAGTPVHPESDAAIDLLKPIIRIQSDFWDLRTPQE
jgi:acetoin utilization deacetylase AcuC-like enzyme